MKQLKTVFLINPPGRLFQRGEDRSQGNIEDSAATSLRAPNDLAYMAAAIRNAGMIPLIRDYPAENASWDEFVADLTSIKPDVLIMSTTNATIYEDIQAFRKAKSCLPGIVTIAKGAMFLSVKMDVLDDPAFASMDFALTGEAESIVVLLLAALTEDKPLSGINGIVYKEENIWHRTPPSPFVKDLDSIPFPARDLLRNELYVRPDTGEPQATIQTSRGCAGSCIFCLTPVISGRSIRIRSAVNIADEIEECISKFGIRNFFFKADTFTMNKPHVIDVCREIIKRKLDIQWVANSRVDTLDDERLHWMRKAGCWLVAVGFESGSETSLLKMKKNTTLNQAWETVRLIRKYDLQLYGFFMIGLPWENADDIQVTLDFANTLRCDYAEIHIAVPYEGTELYTIAETDKLISGPVQGHDYFRDPVMKTVFLTREDIIRLRKKGLKKIYLSPAYVWSRLKRISSPSKFTSHVRYGLKLIRQLL